MQDARGLYYYPTPANKKERMYVRERAGQVEFRLWNLERPEIWDRHDWVPFNAIQQAAAQYAGKGDLRLTPLSRPRIGQNKVIDIRRRPPACSRQALSSQ